MLAHSLPYSGAARTITGYIKNYIGGGWSTPSVSFRCQVPDDRHCPVELRGRLHQHGSKRLVVLIHGLGGSAESRYLQRAVHACSSLRADCLRLSMRGADGRGPDIYNAGLSRDIAVALEAGELSSYESIYLLGYSLGGHLALHFGCTQSNPRVMAIGTLCSPLDLSAASAAFSKNPRSVFSAYVLRSLKASYRSLGPSQRLRLAPSRLSQIHTIRQWDEQIVAPRFGFDSADHYYKTTSVSDRLSDLAYRTEFVTTADDPIIPHHVQRRSQFQLPEHATHIELPGGGHLGICETLDLGEAAPLGVESQLLKRLFRQ